MVPGWKDGPTRFHRPNRPPSRLSGAGVHAPKIDLGLSSTLFINIDTHSIGKSHRASFVCRRRVHAPRSRSSNLTDNESRLRPATASARCRVLSFIELELIKTDGRTREARGGRHRRCVALPDKANLNSPKRSRSPRSVRAPPRHRLLPTLLSLYSWTSDSRMTLGGIDR